MNRSRIFTNRAPSWLRQSGRAAVALGLGTLVGLTAGEPDILLPIAAVILLVFITASLKRPDPLVFLSFVLLSMPKLHIPGSPLPLAETVMLLAVISAFMTLREGLHPLPRWARLLLGLLVFTLVASSVINQLFLYATFKRLLHVAVYALVIIGLVRGLFPRRVAVRGLQTGLVISSIFGLVFLPKSTYAGRFTGLFGDPNVAGLLLVVLGAIALAGITRRRYQVAFLAILLPGLVLAYSRTALLATFVMILWVAFGRRLRPIPSFVAILVAALAIWMLPTGLQNVGPFSDRTGSDQLRDRVATQEVQVVKQSPIIGHGAGTATVMVNYRTTRFFFHNSYLAMMQEGGAIALVLEMGLLVGTFLALISLDTTDRQPILEASIIGVWVMAINLGEVLLELSTAVAIGVAISYIAQVRAARKVDESSKVPVLV